MRMRMRRRMTIITIMTVLIRVTAIATATFDHGDVNDGVNDGTTRHHQDRSSMAGDAVATAANSHNNRIDRSRLAGPLST